MSETVQDRDSDYGRLRELYALYGIAIFKMTLNDPLISYLKLPITAFGVAFHIFMTGGDRDFQTLHIGNNRFDIG